MSLPPKYKHLKLELEEPKDDKDTEDPGEGGVQRAYRKARKKKNKLAAKNRRTAKIRRRK
jgi:hypothetical protein